jgi:hypothetical protein
MPHGKKHNRTKKNRTHRMRGGKGVNMFPNNFESVQPNSVSSSGWSYVNNLVGGLDTQYNNTFLGNGTGNELVIGAQKAPMSGGRRRRHRRGGYFGPVVADAIVPLGLLAAQQTYGKRFKKSRKSRRTRKR